MSALVQEWLEEHRPAIDELAGRASADGVVLDFTPESLPTLVSWVAGQMVRRPEGASTAGAPAWSTDESSRMARWWTDETLHLVVLEVGDDQVEPRTVMFVCAGGSGRAPAPPTAS